MPQRFWDLYVMPLLILMSVSLYISETWNATYSDVGTQDKEENGICEKSGRNSREQT